jgi:hypothetical protein
VSKFTAVFFLLCSSLIVGCKVTERPDQPNPNNSRFQLASGAYAYALDTKTGQICRTFNENPDIHIPKGLTPLDAKPLDRVPLCIDLSQDEAATIKALRGK